LPVGGIGLPDGEFRFMDLADACLAQDWPHSDKEHYVISMPTT
jgi:hypothetical protein